MRSKILALLLVGMCMLGALPVAHADEFQRLMQDLESADEQTRANAVRALGESRDRRAIEPLLEALRDDSALVRKHAVAALRNLAKVLSNLSRLMEWWLRDLLHRLGLEPRDEVITTDITHQGRTEIVS